jgi:hypothetical protein
MKPLQHLFLIMLVVLLGSCSNIVFDEAVPTDQKTLDQFPSDIQGSYLDSERDTLSIFPDRYIYGEIKGNTLLAGQLGPDLVLKQFEDFYFLNFKNENGFWEMIAAQKTVDGLVLMCIDIENKDEIKKINKHISKGRAKSLKKDGKYLINPTTQELIKILNDTSVCEESYLIKL